MKRISGGIASKPGIQEEKEEEEDEDQDKHLEF